MRFHGHRERMFSRAAELIASCARQAADLVCLQELSFDPYFCQSEDHQRFELAESLDGSIARFLAEQARLHSIVLLGGLFERRAPGLFHNSFLIYEKDGSRAGIYRKAHIPDDPCFQEKFYFTPGDDPFPAFDTTAGKIGIGICWDQWFPEAARLTALDGARMLFFPTAIGWLPEEKSVYGESQLNAWQTIMRSHAIANGVFVFAPNRTGLESRIEFWGNSFACDPYGNLLQVAASDQETAFVVDVDVALCETARTHWPFLRDRRIDLYADMTQRWREINQFQTKNEPSGTGEPLSET